jgi:hypothetical protein
MRDGNAIKDLSGARWPTSKDDVPKPATEEPKDNAFVGCESEPNLEHLIQNRLIDPIGTSSHNFCRRGRIGVTRWCFGVQSPSVSRGSAPSRCVHGTATALRPMMSPRIGSSGSSHPLHEASPAELRPTGSAQASAPPCRRGGFGRRALHM